jgi:sulfur carrier protein ThiS
MQVYIERSDEQHELEFSGSAEALCDHFNVNPQTVLIVKDGQLITEEIEVDGAQEVKLITVVSGG